jgi:hypothetical protein
VPLLVAGAATATTGALLGVLFTVAANTKSAEAESVGDDLRTRSGEGSCSHPSAADAADCDGLLELREEQDALANVAIWSFIAAGAFAVGTGVYALWPTSGGGRDPGARVRVAPLVSARGSGLVVAARF